MKLALRSFPVKVTGQVIEDAAMLSRALVPSGKSHLGRVHPQTFAHGIGPDIVRSLFSGRAIWLTIFQLRSYVHRC